MAGVSGVASTTTSLAASSSGSASDATDRSAPATACPDRVSAMVRTPKGARRAISARPMPPAPTMPTVRPRNIPPSSGAQVRWRA